MISNETHVSHLSYSLKVFQYWSHEVDNFFNISPWYKNQTDPQNHLFHFLISLNNISMFTTLCSPTVRLIVGNSRFRDETILFSGLFVRPCIWMSEQIYVDSSTDF